MKVAIITLFFTLVILKFVNADGCDLFGKAPICVEECPPGWIELGTTKVDEDGYCFIGTKKFCCGF